MNLKRALWVSVGGALFGAAILFSGWGRTGDAGADALGTLSNSYYQPRREAATAGGALFGFVGLLLAVPRRRWRLGAAGVALGAVGEGPMPCGSCRVASRPGGEGI